MRARIWALNLRLNPVGSPKTANPLLQKGHACGINQSRRAPLAEFAYKDRDHIIWRIEGEEETLFASNRPREKEREREFI